MPLLTKRIGFTAAHYYWNPKFSDAQNQDMFHACANRHGHGHNYMVEVCLKGKINPKTGMVINFFDLDPLLKRHILDPLDHRNLNAEIPFFQNHIPTLENIACFLWQELIPGIRDIGIDLHHIKVIEYEDLCVEYNGAQPPMLILSKRYRFSAAHRLWNPTFSDAENQQHFGPCINLHGHNYILEIAIQGTPSPETGMIVDIMQLDQWVHEAILRHVDHQYLDEAVSFIQGTLSTVENLAELFYHRLAPLIPQQARLHRVRLMESDTNWAEFINDTEVSHAVCTG